jgi:hypothetical protein
MLSKPSPRTMTLLLLSVALARSPAFAQVDLTGTWVARVHEDQPERGPGPELGDYLGLPINEAARQRGIGYDASLLTLPEWQCRPHPADYGPRHSHVRIWKDIDPATQEVTAWRLHREWQEAERTLFMDGRERPPDYAPHTWQGFSTATWEGNKLKVTTTHLKTGYIRRNGIARSDKATLTEYFIRHGNFLTIVTMIDDPVYLTETMIRTSDYELDLSRNLAPYPCQPVTEIERENGVVPHHLPGTNAAIDDFALKHGLPAEAALGGAETMYPEYQQKLRDASGTRTATRGSR